jgi:hypothetical protein
LLGDYNRNGVVDASDYTVWRDTLGASVTPFSGADGSGNGVADAADYDLWKTHFGQTLSGSGAGSGSVTGLVATASLQSVAVNDSVTASQLPDSPVGDAALASVMSIAPTLPWAGPGANKPLQVFVTGILSDESATAVRQDSALLAWFASRKEGQSRHDDADLSGYVEDRAADKSTDSLFGAVDEVFGGPAIPAEKFHQLISA